MPAFRALWLASIVSWIGSFVQDVAERWLMLDLTHSPLPVAMLSTVFTTASLVSLLPAGILADRVDRRHLVVVSQLAQGTVALGLGVMTWTGHVSSAVLFAAAGLAGIGMAIGQPAWASLVPEMVDRAVVTDAIALNSAAFNLARAIGPALGGLVLSSYGAGTSFLLNGATFAAVIVALLTFRPARRPRERQEPAAALVPHEPVLRAFAAPFRLARAQDELRSPFTAMLAFSLGCSVVYALTPAYARSTLGASAQQYGLMIGAMGAGAVLGATMLRRLRLRLRPNVLVPAAMMFFAVSGLLLSRVRSFPIAALCFVPAGIGWIGAYSSLQALVQLWTPDAVRARMIALYTMLHFVAWGIGASVGGAIAARWGVPAAFALGGTACAVAAVATTRLPLPASFSPPS